MKEDAVFFCPANLQFKYNDEVKVKKPPVLQKLRLDDVLDYLLMPENERQIVAMRDRLDEAGADFSKMVMTPGLSTPSDTFEKAVTTTLYSYAVPHYAVCNSLPKAITTALAEAADDEGMLTAAKAEELFGPKGKAFVEDMLRDFDRMGVETLPTTRPKAKFDWLTVKTERLIARSAARMGRREKMPVLDDITNMLGSQNALKGFRCSAVQHLFPTTRWLFEALADNGLDRRKTEVLGKVYSTDMDTLNTMRQSGWLMSSHSDVSFHEDNDPLSGAKKNLERLFHNIDPQNCEERFLIIDEGGKTLKCLHEHFSEYAHLCVALEHTDRGIQLLEDIELKCPVINVARCEAKKLYESPMIGESIVSSIEKTLAELKFEEADMPKEACVLGYGAVGKNVAASLRRRGFDVFVFDPDSEKREQAQADGMNVGHRDEMLAHGHLLIGASGRGAFSLDEIDKLPKGAILANAASGRHELGLEVLELEHDKKSDPHGEISPTGLRSTLVRGKRVVVGEARAQDQNFHRVLRGEKGEERIALRNGFVVNMSEDIPAEFIQLTRGLILAAALQATQTPNEKVGLIDLDPQTQTFITKRVKKALTKDGLDLEKPDFRNAKH